MKQSIFGWGKYPIIEAEVIKLGQTVRAKEILEKENNLIPRGLGRSYGDSSLQSKVIDCTNLNLFEDFETCIK